MKEVCKQEKCTGCGSCASVCPKGCIHMEENAEGFLYPVINEKECVDCGLCKKSCKVEEKLDNSFKTKAYAMMNNDEKIRTESSSGGVFTLLSEYIIENNGVVYGAAFNDNYEVEHIRVTSTNEIALLRKSKYVQSKIGECYKLAKKDLEENRKVLFTGTPCQIAGLRGYLKKDYDNLYCQDIMCHGVPSPKLWKKYINELGIGKIKSVSFREKIVSWSQYSVKIEGEEGSICERFFENTYMKAFLADIALRKSCNQCNYKQLNYFSDITLADFWGLDKVYPELDDATGVSLVLVSTAKGDGLLKLISDKAKMVSVDTDRALQGNQAAVNNTHSHPKRELFMKNLDSMTVNALVKKYVQKNIFQKIFHKLFSK